MKQRICLNVVEESPKFFLNSILRGVENNEFDNIDSTMLGEKIESYLLYIHSEGTWFIFSVWKGNVSDEYWTALQAAIEIAGGEEE